MTQRPIGAGVPSWLPNALTILRLVLVPVFLALLFAHPQDFGWRLGATVAFGVAILTDMFGGTPSNLAISVMSQPKVEVLAGLQGGERVVAKPGELDLNGKRIEAEE